MVLAVGVGGQQHGWRHHHQGQVHHHANHRDSIIKAKFIIMQAMETPSSRQSSSSCKLWRHHHQDKVHHHASHGDKDKDGVHSTTHGCGVHRAEQTRPWRHLSTHRYSPMGWSALPRGWVLVAALRPSPLTHTLCGCPEQDRTSVDRAAPTCSQSGCRCTGNTPRCSWLADTLTAASARRETRPSANANGEVAPCSRPSC
jgi:hypothetical protein